MTSKEHLFGSAYIILQELNKLKKSKEKENPIKII